MSVKPEIESERTPLDTFLLLVSIGLMLAGIGVFYYYETWAGYERWGAVIGGLLLGCFLAVQTHPGKAFWHFVMGSRVEIRKMVWPSKQETTQTTLMIIAVTIVLALVMWIMDYFLLQGTQWLTGQGG